MEQRIAALERANRQLRVAVVILFVLAAARLIVPASAQQIGTPDVLRAGKFEVVRGGKAMGYLAATDNGGSLDIRNSSGQLVGYFDATSRGAEISMSLGAGQALAKISASDDGGNLDLYRPGGGDGIWLRGGGSEPSINMMNGCIYVLAVRGMRFTSCQ